MRFLGVTGVTFVALSHTAIAAPSHPRPGTSQSLSSNAQSLLSESMEWMDTYYDAKAGYLYDFSAATSLTHETRSSVWYALGLLARNEKGDVVEAEKILQNVINAQYKDPADEWWVSRSCCFL